MNIEIQFAVDRAKTKIPEIKNRILQQADRLGAAIATLDRLSDDEVLVRLMSDLHGQRMILRSFDRTEEI